MPEETLFTDETGAVFRAVHIPAKVQFFRTPPGETEHAVGTVEAAQLTTDPPLASKDLFGEEILFAAAAPWARKTAKALLGV